jgi:hypothetical protein
MLYGVCGGGAWPYSDCGFRITIFAVDEYFQALATRGEKSEILYK